MGIFIKSLTIFFKFSTLPHFKAFNGCLLENYDRKDVRTRQKMINLNPDSICLLNDLCFKV